MSNATAVTDSTFEQEVLQSDTPVLVDFWADWCQPCKAMAPVIDQIASENAGKLKVVKVDVDANGDSAMKFGVMSIPTFILFKDGEAVERVSGYMPKAQLTGKITPHVS